MGADTHHRDLMEQHGQMEGRHTETGASKISRHQIMMAIYNIGMVCHHLLSDLAFVSFFREVRTNHILLCGANRPHLCVMVKQLIINPKRNPT